MALAEHDVIDPTLARDLHAADAFDARVQAAMGRLNAATAELVTLTQEAIRDNWWRLAECHSPEHWLQACCGLDAARARRIARVARGLVDFPQVTDTFSAGLLTEAHADIIATRCDPAFDGDLVHAGNWNIAQTHRMARVFPKLEPPGPGETAPEREPEPAAPVDRFGSGWGDDGRYRGSFDLGPELGGLAAKALEAARTAVFAARRGIEVDDVDAPLDVTALDGLERLLHAALAGLDPATARGQRPSDRCQVMLHLDAEHPERSRIALGPTLTKADREYLTCDSDLRVVLWKGGRPVGLGRRRRTVDPLLRTLIEDRDLGCRACGARGFLHIHHLWYWEDGGPTDPDNLCALCTRCHRAVHLGDLRITGDPERPDGLTITDGGGRPPPRPDPTPPGPPGDPPNPYAPIRGQIMYRYLGTPIPRYPDRN